MLPFGLIVLAAVCGYFLGRRDWKRIADEAIDVAAHSILLAEMWKERYEESEND
jgi:hypothetical protein